MAESRAARAAPAGHSDALSHATVAHQFDDPAQQREAYTLGMWTFLATEVMFFGGLFAGYLVNRWRFPAAFAEASHHTKLALGTLNTGVLLASSLMMALALHAAQEGRRKRLVAFLLLTVLLGVVFLGVKATEYSLEYEERLVPGLNFAREGPEAQQVALFFVLYFFMTGLHAVHVSIGVGVIGTMAFLAWRGRFSAERHTAVELTGLYWHFVDVVWVFLFPLLYLLRR